MKKIELIDDETDTHATAVLHEEAAPETCAGIWAALETPIKGPALHAMMAGREVMVEIPEENHRFDAKTLPLENATITPLPGEIGFIYYPPRSLIDIERPSSTDRSKAFWDLTIFYGRDCRLFTVHGFQPVSIFATITEGLPLFAKCCERVRSEGKKPFTIRRLKGSV